MAGARRFARCLVRCMVSALGAGLGLHSTSSLAMGGHFDADDAVMLAPGRCQVETWAIAAEHGGAASQHLGPAGVTAPRRRARPWPPRAGRVRAES